jgi:hypothetical protein
MRGRWRKGLTGAAASLLLACAGARGAAVQAPVELAITPLGTVPDASIVGAGERGADGRCTVRLVAGPIEKSAPGCYLDEHISEGPGVLLYPCSGTGAAEARFGPQQYSGSMQHGAIELELATELDWEDGCRWGTRTVLRGAVLDGAEPARKKLAWRYQDHVVRGSDCSGVCTAKASIDVQLQPRSGPKPRPSEDDDDEESDWP